MTDSSTNDSASVKTSMSSNGIGSSTAGDKHRSILPIPSPTFGLSAPRTRRKAFKSSLSGSNLASGIRRALSTSVVPNPRKDRRRSRKSALSRKREINDEEEKQADQSCLYSHVHFATYEDSDYSSTDAEPPRPVTVKRGRSADSVREDTKAKSGYTAGVVSRKPLPLRIHTSSATGSASNKSPGLGSALTPSTSTWLDAFRGRSVEKEKEKEKEKKAGRTRERPSERKSKKKNNRQPVYDSDINSSDLIPVVIRRGSSLKTPRQERPKNRKASMPNVERPTTASLNERTKIAPWENMEECIELLTTSSISPTDKKCLGGWTAENVKATKDCWVRAMNAFKSEGKGSIKPKTPQGAGDLICHPASIDDGWPKSWSSNIATSLNDRPVIEEYQGSETETAIEDETSDEENVEDFELEGLRPRPIATENHLERYRSLFREQRWAEAKQLFDLGMFFNSGYKDALRSVETCSSLDTCQSSPYSKYVTANA